MMRWKSTPLALVAFVAIPLLGACDSDTTGLNPENPTYTPAPISFEVGSVTLEVGQTIDLSNYLVVSPSMPVDDLAFSGWMTRDEDTVGVFPGGEVVGLNIGVALVTFECQGERVSVLVEVV